MKYSKILLAGLILIGCKSQMDLTKKEEGERFEQLSLQASYELQNLRIDIIRQEESFQIDSTTTSTEKVSYHPIGFELGNGLFYDLNGNLSLKPQDLLMIDSEESYQIKKIQNIKKEKRIRIKEKTEGQICEEWQTILGKEKRICREIKREGGEIEITKDGKFCYRIIKSRDTLKYTNNKNGKKGIALEPLNGNSYKLKKGKKEKEYKYEGETIELNSKYIVRRQSGGKKLEIYQVKKHKNKLLYTIEKGLDEIYVYNKKSYGYKIKVNQDNLVVYKNEQPLYELERLR